MPSKTSAHVTPSKRKASTARRSSAWLSFPIWGPFSGKVRSTPGQSVNFTGSFLAVAVHEEKNFFADSNHQIVEKDIAVSAAGPTGHGIRIRTQLIVSDISFGVPGWHKAGDFRFALADWNVQSHIPQCLVPDITDWGSQCWEEGSWHNQPW